MSQFLFVNYGGPGGIWLTKNPLEESSLRKQCEKCYFGGESLYHQETYVISGINTTVHSFGIHKALTLELPDKPPPSIRATQAFADALAIAEKFVETDYKIASNNCVTAVATILNKLDSNTTPSNVTIPWSLDKHLSRYCGSYCQETTEGKFIQKYQMNIQAEKIDTPYWSKREIRSVMDIIIEAYRNNKKEKTKSSLIELGWVVDEKGMLIPTENAPADFKEGLNKYNEEYKRITMIMELHRFHDPYGRENIIFKDASSFNIIKERMQNIAKRNPNSLCANTPKDLEKIEFACAANYPTGSN